VCVCVCVCVCMCEIFLLEKLTPMIENWTLKVLMIEDPLWTLRESCVS
jgi:hypothetical protein